MTLLGFQRMTIDQIDRRILDALQKHNQVGMDRLGAMVGLSTSAAQRRVKRLRDTGVIAADVSVVDPGALGRQMTFIVEVTLERESANVFATFKRRMRKAPEVQQCYYVTGEGDFALIVTASDMAELERAHGCEFNREIAAFEAVPRTRPGNDGSRASRGGYAE
jgi:Lrp/AsnC family transcriptional regulator, leucine-responsive regulatory protein